MDFWRAVREVLFTSEGGRAVAEYFLSLKIGAFPRPVIVSQLALLAIETSLTTEETFLAQWNGVESTATQLFEAYTSYAIENHRHRCPSTKSFGRLLIKPVATGVIKKRFGRETTFYYK